MDKLKFKFFTLKEANQLVPEISATFREIDREKNILAHRLLEAAELKKNVGNNGNKGALKDKIEEIGFLQELLWKNGEKLLEKGLVIRDYDRGIIDFPTIIQEDLGYFCWNYGEDKITSWHPVGDYNRQYITESLKLLTLNEKSD